MRARTIWGLLAAVVASMPAPLAAQTSSTRTWTLAPYFARSVASPVGVRWGLSPDRRHIFLGLHATIPLVERPRMSFRYAPELVPVLVVTNNPKYRTLRIQDGDGLIITEEGTGPVAGFAIGPIGFEGRLELSQRWTAYGAGALGGVWFTRQVPILNSRLFNFTAEFGGGLLRTIRPDLALRFGYKFHHLSNAHTAPENPGIDGHVLLIGFERTFGGQ